MGILGLKQVGWKASGPSSGQGSTLLTAEWPGQGGCTSGPAGCSARCRRPSSWRQGAACLSAAWNTGLSALALSTWQVPAQWEGTSSCMHPTPGGCFRSPQSSRIRPGPGATDSWRHLVGRISDPTQVLRWRWVRGWLTNLGSPPGALLGEDSVTGGDFTSALHRASVSKLHESFRKPH